MKIYFGVLFFFMSLFQSFSQNPIGSPDIINYSKDIYNGGTQNWDITQDRNGIIYFANNEGLLSYDGTYWKEYPISNQTSVRSIVIGGDNKIYVGGQDEFGYFSPNKQGKLIYVSLTTLLSDRDKSFGDVWDVVSYNNAIFFRSKSKIFELKNKNIKVYPTTNEWQFLGVSNNQLIAQDSKNGLLQFANNAWISLADKNVFPSDVVVTSLLPLGKDSLLIITRKSGIFILNDDKISKFQFKEPDLFTNNHILGAVIVNNDLIAIGTNVNGCYIINKKGEIIQNFSRKEGLQNNSVVSLFLDRNNNLWLGLDNGIDFIACNNAIKHIYPDELNEGAGYTSIVFNNELYFGTSVGLYKVPLSDEKDISSVKGKFEIIPNTKCSVWGLSEVNGNLLAGMHDGASQIKNDNTIPINNHTGYWTFLLFNNSLLSSLIVAGNYNGLDFFQYKNNSFISEGNLTGFNESARFLTVDSNNTIWVAHPYRGVYNINIKEISNASEASPLKIKLYTDKNGLPSSIQNHLFKIKNRIVVVTQKGIYEYNKKTDLFEPSAYFKKFFGERNIRHLKEDKTGNIWFVENNDLGVIDFSGQQPQTIYFPELNGKMVSGFEHVNPLNRYNVIVGAEKGFYHINYEEYKKNSKSINVNIRAVKAIGKTDTSLFDGYFSEVNEITSQSKNAVSKISNDLNSFHFEYSASAYEHQSSVEYSYYLRGFDKEWSGWSKKTEKDYTNLPAGKYTFQVKAKTNLGIESSICNYSFTVLPSWYQTDWAYFIYVLLAFGVLYLIYQWQRKMFLRQQKKYEEEKKRMQYLHELEIEKSEKEIIKLKNEKLEAEIDHKNKELASTALHLVQKGELLANIREEINRLKKGSNGDKISDEYKKIQRILEEENKRDEDWQHFTIHFDKVHSDFLKTLKLTYPNLSAHELKLCAYLQMNLSSKEIAQLENISVRGVEIGRYRLRKKLQIPTETNLFDFLLKFSSVKEN